MSTRTISRLGAVAALLLASACSQRTESFLDQFVGEGARQIAGLARTPAPPPPLPSRAELDGLPGPLLAISFANTPGTGFVTAVNATRDGYITYQDRTRRSIIVRGGLITGLQGFRFDLSAVKTQRDDPVVYQTPVAAWPSMLNRNYQFSQKSAPDFQISVHCQVTRVAQETITVFERSYAVVRMQETCANDRRRFANIYWVDPGSGFIWKSMQWVGPRIQPIALEVVRPHPSGPVKK